jgi:predicted pyridoxine 5'-phosphate oxidase superfamily flavin-nucleotide-binding protein
LPSHDDPLRALVREGREIGTLVIDLASRGRLRVNGLVTTANDAFFEFTVRESFANCKKYIQRRVQKQGHHVIEARDLVERGDRLDASRRRTLASVDTCFVASRHPVRGIDASHRGGRPGFVRVLDDRRLRFPDYAGNGMFQTLGNFEVDSRAGVLAVDFEGGRLLSLTGLVTVGFGLDESEDTSAGTGRTWELVIDEWVDFPMPSGHEFLLIEPSPHNPPAFPIEP